MYKLHASTHALKIIHNKRAQENGARKNSFAHIIASGS
jgi:hypothetical protein